MDATKGTEEGTGKREGDRKNRGRAKREHIKRKKVSIASKGRDWYFKKVNILQGLPQCVILQLLFLSWVYVLQRCMEII